MTFPHPHLRSIDSSSSCLLWAPSRHRALLQSPGEPQCPLCSGSCSEQAENDSQTGPSDRNGWIFWETARQVEVLSCLCASCPPLLPPRWHLTQFWGVSRAGTAVPALCARSADAELGILLLSSSPFGAGKQIHQVLSAWRGAEPEISGLEYRSCSPGKGGPFSRDISEWRSLCGCFSGRRGSDSVPKGIAKKR